MPAIDCQNLTVEFPIYDARARSLRQSVGLDWIRKQLRQANVGGHIEADRRGRIIIKALRDINLRFQEGDRIGLLGHNGSGKTTLLRALAGIYEPTGGALYVEGRVTPLFDLQLGMDPDQTGIENIALRGHMLGLTNAQIKANIESVMAFTQLEDYLLMPIRTYSAGMSLRLAFAIATAVSPEILLLDEMIGAGDAAFVEAAQRRLQAFIGDAGIVVLASHNVPMLRRWCNKGVLLHHGMVMAFGTIEEAIAQYEQVVSGAAAPPSELAAT